jgi:hypothetical protein
LGIGDWGLGPIPNPQSPIPNPQSPIPNPHLINLIIKKYIILSVKQVYKIKLIKIIYFLITYILIYTAK